MDSARAIVFFGMDGGYSTTVLSHLVAARFDVELVVQGLIQKPGSSGSTVELVRAKRPWFARKSPTKGGPTDLAACANRLGIDALRTNDANSAKVRAKIAAARAEAFVVAGFPHLLSAEVLGLARKGGLNLHPGKLPEERGPSPLFWTLKAGRSEVHFTIHVLDEGEDSGDVVATGEIAFAPGTDGEEILGACAETAAPELTSALQGLLDGDLIRSPQPDEQKGRCPRPTFRDCRIDPERSALEVFTFVGGCARTHSLFAECGGDRFFVKRAETYDLEAKLAFEFALTGDRLLLRCSPGVVELILKEGGALFSAEY